MQPLRDVPDKHRLGVLHPRLEMCTRRAKGSFGRKLCTSNEDLPPALSGTLPTFRHCPFLGTGGLETPFKTHLISITYADGYLAYDLQRLRRFGSRPADARGCLDILRRRYATRQMHDSASSLSSKLKADSLAMTPIILARS